MGGSQLAGNVLMKVIFCEEPTSLSGETFAKRPEPDRCLAGAWLIQPIALD